MKNNRLSFFSALVAGLLVAQTSGCASLSSQGLERTDEGKSSLTIDEGSLGAATLFTPTSVEETAEEDFWGTNVVARVDEEGRLVYSSKTKAINDPQRMRNELAAGQQNRAWTPWGSPIAGQPMTENGRIFFSTTGVRETAVQQSMVRDQRQVRPAPKPRPIAPQPERVVPKIRNMDDGTSKR